MCHVDIKDLHFWIPELRMQEMVSMGIGSKPFMDIKPSDAAISDRAIDYIMKGSGEPFLHFMYFSLSISLQLSSSLQFVASS